MYLCSTILTPKHMNIHNMYLEWLHFHKEHKLWAPGTCRPSLNSVYIDVKIEELYYIYISMRDEKSGVQNMAKCGIRVQRSYNKQRYFLTY